MTGLVLVVVSVQFSVMANTVVKLLAGVPFLHLMQARFLLQWLVSLSICLALRCRGHSIHIFGRPGYRRLLTARACTFSGGLGCLWCALRSLPVGEVTAITYLNPVVCGCLAMCFLREKLGWRFSVQATASCLGVLLVVNPSLAFHLQPKDYDGGDEGMSPSSYGLMFAIIGCFCFATDNCLVNALQGVHPLEVQVYLDAQTALVMLPAAQLVSGAQGIPCTWDGHRAALLVAFTAFGLGASFCTILGFTLAPAGKATLFTYMEVPSAFVVQTFFFGHVPRPMRLCGASLIVAGAIWRLWHEVSGAEPLEPTLLSPMGPPTPLTSPYSSPLSSTPHLKHPLLEGDITSVDAPEQKSQERHISNIDLSSGSEGSRCDGDGICKEQAV